ncbi:MAG: M20/M25/M40 family metallo-hydrolase [Sphaerobacteraceae bacterium]|nr:MAG: M20/M25/M40 family metallo-hydrolase [Sphaerobacteraceae bacterium]
MADQALMKQMMDAVDAAHDEIVELCQEIVRVPSVSFGDPDSGDELPAAELIQAKLAKDGIEADIYKPRPNRGNLIANYDKDKKDASPSLLLMSHTDVVPVEDESQWTYPPFGAEIHDNRIYGRGAADMKGTVASQAMALILLKRAGVELDGRLTFATCADEETGGVYGFGWQVENHPETLKADYAVNEGGGDPTHGAAGMIYEIATGEKGRLEMHFHIAGKGFHASQPWRADNAIYKAQELIRRIENYEPEVSVEAEIFGHLDKLAGLDEEVTVDNLEEILERVGKSNYSLASKLRACSRMTLVASMMNAGVKSNSVAENCTIVCDVRSLPSQDKAYVEAQAAKIAEGIDGVTFHVHETSISNASSFDSPFRSNVEEATRAALGNDDITFLPGLTVGFTDSRLVRPLGNTIYGFTPSHPDDDPSLSGAHNINESLGIETLILRTKYHIALALSTLKKS